MPDTRKINKNYLTIYIRRFLICAVPMLVAAYSIWYWSFNHEQLTDFYKGLDPNFYKAKDWGSLFFTSIVKSQGNWWCLAAMVASVSWAIIVWKTKWPVIPKLVLTKNTVLIYTIIAIAGLGLSIVANMHTRYGTDEVFSALNFASIPPFQCISYYALPNNHILFNFINGINIFWLGDLVRSGRIISLICYIIALCSSWYFLQKWIQNNWLKCLSLLLLALQLPPWGFSGQARGYEMLLLLSLLSFITFWTYWFENKKILLSVHAFCNVAGMLTVPSFMYWWFGIIIAAFLLMIWQKHLDKNYIKATITSSLITLILYLPMLSFSGLSAMTENTYVKPGNSNVWEFIKDIYEQHYFRGLFDEWYCSGNYTILIGLACFLCPLLLLFYVTKNKKYRDLSIIYFSMIIAFISLSILMLRLPFNRNLIAHGYISEMFILITLISLLKQRNSKIVFGILLSVIIVFSAYTNYNRMPVKLYDFDVNSYYKKLSECKTIFKSGCTVYLDDECFYWHYILSTLYHNQNIQIMYNGTTYNKQDYCIMPTGLQPPSDSNLYKIVESNDEYRIFKKNQGQ
jgi:hypothetical protein